MKRRFLYILLLMLTASSLYAQSEETTRILSYIQKARDYNKGISSISYDQFGNLFKVTFGNKSSIEYVYSADGIKLKARHITAIPQGTGSSSSSTNYIMSDSWDRSLSPLSCILPGLYSNSKNECVSLYFDSKYPNNVNYKNVLPEGIKGYVYKIY